MPRGLVVAALVIAAALPLLRGFLSPFVTRADKNTAMFAQPARNYLRHGLLTTRLGLTYNTGEGGAARFSYNTHHPPLQSLAVAGVFVVTGVSDWAARIYPALCSAGSALLLFLIWRRHRGTAPAALAALMMAGLPGFGHFGKMLGEEAPTLFFGLLTIALYQRWKEAAPPAGAWTWALSWAVGCLSGWAAFHVGPLLMGDAAVTLRSRVAKRRRALLVLALTGLLCFALILAHVAVLTGSIDVLMVAARDRTIGPGAEPASAGPDGPLAWLKREAEYFGRLHGVHAPLLLAGGLLAGVAALARPHPTLAGATTVLVLAGFGVAHPLVFPWAAWYHDWLLFHLLPLVAVCGAEGLLLLAGLAQGALRLARAPAWLAGSAAIGLILAGLAGHTILGVRQAGQLQEESPCHAWPLIGREISRLTAGDAHIMANFPFRDAPLRFYADRPSSTVRTPEAYDQLIALRRYELYVRDLNVPIAPGLELLLQERPCLEVAAFALCALVPGSVTASVIAAEAAATPRRETASASIEAAFGTALRLTGYEWTTPPARPVPPAPLERFLGLAGQRHLRDRIIRVSTRWILLEPPSPPWRITTAMTVDPPGGEASRRLAPVALLAQRDRAVPPPAEGGVFTTESAFLLADDARDDSIHLRWSVSDAAGTVRPVLPGPPRPLLKMVVSDPIPLFGAAPRNRRRG